VIPVQSSAMSHTHTPLQYIYIAARTGLFPRELCFILYINTHVWRRSKGGGLETKRSRGLGTTFYNVYVVRYINSKCHVFHHSCVIYNVIAIHFPHMRVYHIYVYYNIYMHTARQYTYYRQTDRRLKASIFPLAFTLHTEGLARTGRGFLLNITIYT